MRSLDRCPAPHISPFKRITATVALAAVTLAGCTTKSEDGSAEGLGVASSVAAMDLVFTANPHGHDQMFEMPLAAPAEPPVSLTDAACDSHNPQPRPNSRQVVYYSNCAGGPNQVFMLDLDSHARTQLTYDTRVQNYDPTYVLGPDNESEIVWKRSDLDGNYGELWAMDTDGSNWHNLTPRLNAAKREAWKPAVISPGWLLFTIRERQSDPRSDGIFGLNLADGKTHRLASGWFPSYNPQQNKVVFVMEQDGHDVLATMNLDGKNIQVIVDIPGDNDDPWWSPDGSTLLFINNRRGKYSVYAYTIATERQTRLYDGNRYGRALAPILVPHTAS